MNNNKLVDDLVNSLEADGEIRMYNDRNDIYIQSIDDKEGYSFISNNDKHFSNSEDAVKWALQHFDGMIT